MVVAVILILLLFAKQAKSQSNKVEPKDSYESQLLAYKQSVFFKNPELEKQAYDIARAEKLIGTKQGQCIVAARNFTGRADIRGQASRLPVNSEQPQVGAIVKLNESKSGHVGVVLYIRGEEIYIYESNYNFSEQAGTRWLSINNSAIVGYWIGGENQ